MQLHTPIFSQKYLDSKTINFDITKLHNLEGKVRFLNQWQESIRSGRILKAKEEELQADFLNNFFGDVLGFEYRNSLKWNLAKEHKTITDGTKSDGALGYFSMISGQLESDVRVVIELKDARSNLDKAQNRQNDKRSPVEQAFGYASKSGGKCKWVIVSNFVELRFYHANDQSRYEKFDLTRLTDEKELTRLFFLLDRERLTLQNDEAPTERLYRERQEQEQTISKEFYKDYKKARLDLFRHLCEQNLDTDELTIFNKTQKLLDRVIFICFCEDKNIIPMYTFRGLLKIVKEDRFDRSDSKIYNRVKGLFQAIDEGYPDAGINKFNGGLFAPDNQLDALKIKDSTLEFIISLEKYDFDSDLNVNILGHIFEQSISDIEEIKAQLLTHPSALGDEGIASTISKRKKDGIFYTPEYITRYIVKEAIGGWLADRKVELGFDKLPELTDDDRASIRFDAKKKLVYNKNVEKQLRGWEAYREKLINIKVLDPACGSGAFLNQVFDFLYTEGQFVNRELARLRGGQTDVFDIEKHILTNNIFGVDLNAESVEITKLSLWLKTANRYKELTTLDANIRCGNSLIQDSGIGDNFPFVWESEFIGIFQNGGFDVVVGNPPYVRQELLGKANKQYYVDKFKEVGNGTADLYVYFYELALSKLKANGYVCYITPNKFIRANYGKNLRKYLSQFQIRQIIDFGELPVFDDAATFPAIISIKKTNEKLNIISAKIKSLSFSDLTTEIQKSFINVPIDAFQGEKWQLSPQSESLIFDKIKIKGIPLEKYSGGRIYYGIKTGFNEAFVIDKSTKDQLIARDIRSADIIKPFIIGDNVRKYRIDYEDKYLILTRIGVDINQYPAIFQYLSKFQTQLEKRYDKGKYWWELRACDYYDEFIKPKIIYPEMALSSRFTYDKEFFYTNNKAFIIPGGNLFLLAYLNSTLIWYYLKTICSVLGDADNGGRLELRPSYLKDLPIYPASIEQQSPFIDAAEIMLAKNKELQELNTKFLTLLEADFNLKKLSSKLQKWYELEWGELQKELEKAKVKLSLSQKGEWLSFFNSEKAKAQAILSILNQTEYSIDRMVYNLYNLTDEEIKLVESGS